MVQRYASDVVVGVAYDTDLNKALSAIDQVLKANPRALQDPEPMVLVTMLANSSINISIKPWVDVESYPHMPGEINKAVVEAFRSNGIAIPFPQREVRLVGGTG